jgi:orotidine-5'-phosphate decarboxylase
VIATQGGDDAPAAGSAPLTERTGGSSFGSRVADAVQARQSQLVLGLDPDPVRLWPRALDLAGGPGAPAAPPAQRAALAVAIHCTLAIEAAAEHCVAVKPQVACFERLGAPGWAALAEVVQRAHERDLLVIADAKRGDIDVTAAAYAAAFLGQTQTPYGVVDGLQADALTVNPLLGADSVAPLLGVARERAAGLFLLVRTSNPGAADVQGDDPRGATVSRRLGELVEVLGDSGSRLSDVGAVVGATAPEWIAGLREVMPRAIFLLPGIGAQGGRVEDLAPAFAPGRAGGLVTASRTIVRAHEGTSADPATAAREAAARLRQRAWDLSG